MLDEARLRAQEDNEEAARNLSATLNSISKALTELGQIPEALQYAKRSLAMDERTAERESLDLLAQRDLSASLNDVAALDRLAGNLESSERYQPGLLCADLHGPAAAIPTVPRCDSRLRSRPASAN